MSINSEWNWLQEISQKIAHTPAEKIFLACMGIDAVFFIALLAAFFFNLTWENHFWPPPEMPKIPFSRTVLNGLFLLMSVLPLFQAFRFLYIPEKRPLTRHYLGLTIMSGTLFFLSQAMEWGRMLAFAWQNPLNLLSAFFYPLIIFYALHLLGGLTALTLVMQKLKRDAWMLQPVSQARIVLGQTHLALVGAYWIAIVLIWPMLYYLVYL